MYLPLHSRAPTEQNNKNNGQPGKKHILVICIATIICALTFLIMTFFVLRTLRRMNCRPKYLPGKYPKEKWTRWGDRMGTDYGHVPPQPPTQGAAAASHLPERGTEMNTTTNANTGGGGIQRDTSVRSIITLPAYSSSPKPTEQIIAREGERAGMDVVVEFPETAEEEESRREDLMESLYQVRLQRREENARRRARRDARREARANGDAARLEQLRMESQRRRDRSGTDSSHQSVSTRLREHRERSQDGRTSRVNYGELGCVRHDGSRVRANSAESDSRPLLDASAPMSGHHARGDSVSSFVSGSTVSLGDTVTPIPSHPHSVRQSMSGDGDVGALNIPPPPDYEHLDWGDAPAYERREREPDSSQHLQLPEFTPLPAIQIDMASPVSDSPVSPMHLGRAAHEHRTSDSPGSSSPSTPDNAQPEPEGGHSDVPTTSSGNDSATPGPHPQREHEPSTGNSPTSPATATATAPTAQTEHGHQPQSSNASGST